MHRQESQSTSWDGQIGYHTFQRANLPPTGEHLHTACWQNIEVHFDILDMLQRSKFKNASLILSPLFSRTIFKLWCEENIEWVVYFQKPFDYDYFFSVTWSSFDFSLLNSSISSSGNTGRILSLKVLVILISKNDNYCEE